MQNRIAVKFIDFALKSIKVGDDIAPSNSTLDDLFDKTFIPHDLTKMMPNIHASICQCEDPDECVNHRRRRLLCGISFIKLLRARLNINRTCIIQVHVELKGVDDNKNVSNVKMKDYRAH
ncbi:unnamed protein product [Rotaria magnacalcarata]